jgi:uncharacterized membrane protein YbhN (UPF0104 family)
MKRWLAALVSLALIVTLVRLAGVRTVWQAWTEVHPAAIAASVACYLAALGVRVVLWRALLGGGLTSFVRPIVVGSVLGHVLPLKVGDVAPALLVARVQNLPLPRTLSTLTVERVSQLIALIATFLPAAWLALAHTNAFPQVERAALAFLALTVGAAVLVLAIAATRRGRSTNRLLRAWHEYAQSLGTLVRAPRTLALTSSLGLTYWVLQYASLWAVLRGGGLAVGPVDAAAVCGAAVIGGTLSAIPLGTQDGISAVVLGALGFPTDRGFALALFHTALSLICGLTCVAVALAYDRGRLLNEVLRPEPRNGE